MKSMMLLKDLTTMHDIMGRFCRAFPEERMPQLGCALAANIRVHLLYSFVGHADHNTQSASTHKWIQTVKVDIVLGLVKEPLRANRINVYCSFDSAAIPTTAKA
jgi:hypothetical protein